MSKQFIAGCFLVGVFAATTLAQSSVEQSVKGARERFSDIKNRSGEIERVKRQSNKRTINDNSTLKFPEIKKDFEQIQKINRDVVLQINSAETPIVYKTVLKFVSEINNRAIRLKSNLFGSQPKKEARSEQQSAFEAQNIKILINDLDKFINRFVHSSIFQNINVVNSKDSLTAQNDLETVIKISSSIKEKAKKLTKVAPQ